MVVVLSLEAEDILKRRLPFHNITFVEHTNSNYCWGNMENPAIEHAWDRW